MSADGDGNGAASGSGNVITLPRTITVRDLGEALNATSVDVIKQLMKRGVMAAINQSVEYEMAASVAQELGFDPRPEEGNGARAAGGAAVAEGEREEADTNLEPRPPVVTVMGHVDHGKTSLLDAIREANVVATEAGAITQHIGAYQVEVKGQKITFIDTPGHEAFTAMRARGANVTDIAVLVVAADDGVMPQTIEAIAHAKAAGVPIIMAINKIDLPAAEPDRVKQQLTQHDVVIEEYGGDIPAIPVSAKTKQGLDNLLEHIQLVAEISELKASRDRPAEGTVIEAEKDPNRGPMATVIIEKGTLRVGDPVVAGESWGKVKAMFNDRSERITEATPAMPAEVMGLESVPKAGDALVVVEDERTARDVAEERRRQAMDSGQQRVTLEAVSGDIAAGRTKDLNVIIKADVQGSVEAIRSSVERLATPEVRVNIIHTGTGAVSESDAMLAAASKAVIVAFNVKAEPGAKRLAEKEGIDLRNYRIIYELLDDIDRAVKGLIEPVIVEVIDGHAEVKAIFRVRGGRIAGSAVTDGVVRRNSLVRLMREGELIHTSRVSSLRRFQEDVREVTEGLECGIGVERFDRFQEGDIIEAYHTEQKG
jgi:translation initiation factor IF-2